MQKIGIRIGLAGILFVCGSPAASGSVPGVVAQDVRAPSAAETSPKPSLDKTSWTAIELGGQPVIRAKPGLEARFTLENGRLTGADGCAHVSGSYQTMAPIIQFGPLSGGAKACPNGDATGRALREALAVAHVFRIRDQRLELMDQSGKMLARFSAPTPKVPPSVAAPALAGTSWRFVKFQAADGPDLASSERSSHTIDFSANGDLSAIIGCRRARSTWQASGRSDLQIGPLALKGKPCSSGAVDDHLIKNLERVRSYAIRDNHLFLALMADAGVYEYERAKPLEKRAAKGRRTSR